MPNADLCRGPAAAAWATSLRPTDRQLLDQFVAGRDEEAFAELVRRHGPMVLAVCRRVLGDRHAADDAFQATFLLLVRKSDSLRAPDLLANWLYGVAARTAMKARARASRRPVPKRRAEPMTVPDPSLDATMRELHTVLDEELSSLPEKYRAPLVLCYLEGKTNLQAARELGWPQGSISRRLARGLELLRSRLTRRGLTLSALLLALLLSQEAAGAAVPAALIHSTARAAALTAAGKATAQTTSTTVAELTEDMLQASSSFSAWRLGALSLLLVLLLVGAWIWNPTAATAWHADGARPPGSTALFGSDASNRVPAVQQANAPMDAVQAFGCPLSGCSAGP